MTEEARWQSADASNEAERCPKYQLAYDTGGMTFRCQFIIDHSGDHGYKHSMVGWSRWKPTREEVLESRIRELEALNADAVRVWQEVSERCGAAEARARELEAALNAVIEASSIAEFGRLAAEAQVSKLKAALEQIGYGDDGLPEDVPAEHVVARYEEIARQALAQQEQQTS